MKILCKIIGILVLIQILSGCQSGKTKSNKIFYSASDLKDARIGVLLGSVHVDFVEEEFPEATIVTFNSCADCYQSLNMNKVDAIVIEDIIHSAAKADDPSTKILVHKWKKEDCGMGFKKGNDQLRNEFNAFLAQIREDGTLERITKKWDDSSETAPMPEWDNIPREGEPIKIACDGQNVGLSFYRDGKLCGLEIEILERFAAHVKRPIEMQTMYFSGLLSAVSTGKADIICSCICITEERLKQIDFSDVYYYVYPDLIINSKYAANGFRSFDDPYVNKIGVLLGSAQEEFARKNYPEKERLTLNNTSDLLLALRSGQCDAILTIKETGLAAIKESDGDLAVLENDIILANVGACFNKETPELRDKFNEFLAKIRGNGVYEEIVDRWLSPSIIELPNIDAPNIEGPTLKISTSGNEMPFSFIKDNKPAGFDIELGYKFAEYIGYKPEIVYMDFGALIPSLVAKKTDIILSSVMITKERGKSVDFSNSYCTIYTTVLCKKEKLANIPNKDGSDIATSIVGTITSSSAGTYIEGHYPQTTIADFDNIPEGFIALSSDKIDYMMICKTSAEVIRNQYSRIQILPGHYGCERASVVVKKGDTVLLNQINNAISELKADGTINQIIDRWVIKKDYKKINVPIENNGLPLIVGISTNREPMTFIYKDELAGVDIEMLYEIGKKIGRKIEFRDIMSPALPAAIITGKVDAIASEFMATEERLKIGDFSQFYYEDPLVLISYLNEAAKVPNKKPFYKKVAQSFYNNLILENRYQLIIKGLWQTVFISFFSIILGSILGAGVCAMRMSKRAWVNVSAKTYVSVMRGVPVLVLLMLIFYVVFAKMNISATLTAIITFALNFAAYVSEMFRSSIESIDRGQKEAGVAMGFTPYQTFLYIIMPQARKRVLPIYKGESISLVKMTSIVGYIAVQDLTKVSDIIRSRTFDAFFPLIIITIIYFILAWLLSKALDLLNKEK